MDPFSERDIIESLKSMAASLRNIDRKIDDIAMSLRELNSSDEDDIEEADENFEDRKREEIAEK